MNNLVHHLLLSCTINSLNLTEQIIFYILPHHIIFLLNKLYLMDKRNGDIKYIYVYDFLKTFNFNTTC